MMKKMIPLLVTLGLLTVWTAPTALAVSPDYAQDVSQFSDPSPRNLETGSSVEQFGAWRGTLRPDGSAALQAQDSQVDNYVNQDEQINLDKDSGLVKVLRTNQKALINEFVTALVPLRNANPRELRGLARTVCRKEGGDADVLQDKVGDKYYLVVVCPEFQLPYLMETFKAIDHKWVAEVNDGSNVGYYRAKNRDVHNLLNILRFYITPDFQMEFDDANNAVLYFDQPCIEPLFKKGLSEVDIPPSQLGLDVSIYEVATQDDLHMGFDFESWKNGPGRDLMRLILWDFTGDEGDVLFPGSVSGGAQDWGRFYSYNLTITTAYIDFLRAKGKARLLTRGSIAAKSGSVGQLAAVDQLVGFETQYGTVPDGINRTGVHRLSDLYDYYYARGEVSPSLTELLREQRPPTNRPAFQIVNDLEAFLTGVVGISGANYTDARNQLDALAADGLFSSIDAADVNVRVPITFQNFEDRALGYRKQTDRVGVLLTIVPVVGLQSAEVSLGLDVTDVVSFTPAGDPVIEHRYLGTTVEVQDGKPIVLAGVRKHTNVKSYGGVPVFNRVPYLKWLFGREITEKKETDIVVIATPRFKLGGPDVPETPTTVRTCVQVAETETLPDLPKNWWGYDQWLLDGHSSDQ